MFDGLLEVTLPNIIWAFIKISYQKSESTSTYTAKKVIDNYNIFLYNCPYGVSRLFLLKRNRYIIFTYLGGKV
ncbi:hypothetical protein EUGRSUZ_D02424 [Eucalyptus grandis]|uniref:Uncharacterized protein n=2 Tax=Eucalyptus grandis TaxID=71139 RepID=A0ACC3L7Z1_EUCGR|nr:hypothetical protein EUGRSUZ_D02424 [Eucalyptus grandis]